MTHGASVRENDAPTIPLSRAEFLDLSGEIKDKYHWLYEQLSDKMRAHARLPSFSPIPLTVQDIPLNPTERVDAATLAQRIEDIRTNKRLFDEDFEAYRDKYDRIMRRKRALQTESASSAATRDGRFQLIRCQVDGVDQNLEDCRHELEIRNRGNYQENIDIMIRREEDKNNMILIL